MARSQWTDAGASQTSAGQARRGAVIALSFSLAMAFGLAACTTSKPSPTPEPSVTVSSAPSATPTPSGSPTWEPVRPDSTKSEGLDGAIATARFFLSLYPYVYQTGDLSEWNAMSHPDCGFCGSVATKVNALHAAGRHTEGGEVRVEGAPHIERNASGTEVIVTLAASHAEIRELSSDGSVVSTLPAVTNPVDVLVWRHGATWLVHGVKVKDPL